MVPVSRSPSPPTPDGSDPIDPLTIHSDAEHTSSWVITAGMTAKSRHTWSESLFSSPQSKSDDDNMLPLDDLIDPLAYHDAPSPCTSSSQISSPRLQMAQLCAPSEQQERTLVQNAPTNSFFAAPRNTSVALTKPEPPPPPQQRKSDPASLNNRVVTPPRESCLNFPLIFPSIPENGTKSRVETQVRITVDLADPSSIMEPYKYDRVGSWKWLKLPPGTATKRRTRKQGKIDPSPQDTLYLQAYVICASPPHNRVFSCTSCQTREAKRVAKKLAARVRPARSDSDSNGDPSRLHGRSKHHEDTTSIIQFNCAEVLEFSTGSVVLPLRITCYCRHHREKVGFLVNMQMLDYTGRIVAFGQTKPIMITDDHKTAAALQARNGDSNAETSWSQLGPSAHSNSGNDGYGSGKRGKDLRSPAAVKRRPKPYDSRHKPSQPTREGSLSSPPSPSTPYSALPGSRSPTPSHLISQLLSPDGLISLAAIHDITAPGCPTSDDIAPNLCHSSDALSDLNNFPTSMPSNTPTPALPNLAMPHPHSMSLMFFDPIGMPQLSPGHAPTIHRLIPNTGPTHGGIEVTVLGANFHANEQLTCVFGGVSASSTQRWSDNTLVCILPPRSAAGIVAVWIDKYQEMQPNTSTSLFTYSDESDRTLMELALQVVGLKMTGKIEDAKDVAMRIVGGAGEPAETQISDNNSVMTSATTYAARTREVLPLLMNSGRETENFEVLIVNFLTLLDAPLERGIPSSIHYPDAVSHTSASGQTLLHYAVFLGFELLTKFLVSHGVDIDARDRNGFTAIHFAALSGSGECIRTLLEAGADPHIVDALGRTPAEVAQAHVLNLFQAPLSDSDDSDSWASDEEAVWGDAEEEATAQVPRRPPRRLSKRTSKRDITSRPLGPTHVESFNAASTLPATHLPSCDKSQSLLPIEQPENTSVDVKQTAWLTEVLQRTFAQLQAPQGIISNIPQLPLPNLPHLSNLPTVPWNSLPQIPVVFPVFVPTTSWPSFLQGTNDDKGHEQHEATGVSAGALRTAHELRAMFDKWLAMVAAAPANQQGPNQQLDDAPPPRYTPRAEAEADPIFEASTSHQTSGVNRAEANVLQPITHSDIRPVDYVQVDREVNAYAYAPNTKQAQKLRKKDDRMLIVFWLPILCLSCIWAFYSFVVFAFQAVKTFLPLKAPLKG